MKTIEEYAQMIDYTMLKVNSSIEDVKKACQACQRYQFKMLAIHSSVVKQAKEYLKDSKVHVGAAISFPHGQTTIAVKAFETSEAIKEGSDEIDYVINITEVKNKNWTYIEEEMETIVSICKQNNVISKVIFETCYLNHDEIIKLCQIANKIQPDFIKTSTGFGKGGATIEHIQLMKKHIDPNIGIKASGGIKTVEDFLAMIEAGATRIGTSNGDVIIDALKKLHS